MPEEYYEDVPHILSTLVSNSNTEKYHYTHRQGDITLRQNIANFMQSKGVNTKPSEIQVASETYQTMEYIGNLIINPGEVIITEEPVCPDIFRIFQSSGAKIITVEMDEEGIICDNLENLIVRYNPKLIYVNPDFQNPTGIVMSLERRKQLLSISYKYKVPIVEEDVYSEIRFEGDRIPSLKALDKKHNVIYLYSFIGTLASGVSIAFAIADETLIKDIPNCFFTCNMY